jgi:1-aminocyclopropane-1-carboxylate deaminase
MLEKFERYPLTFGPTPIERLKRLSAHLGGEVELYAKREDCNSGLAYGGNKLRKLEYIIPDAIASNADTWCRSAACSRTTRARWLRLPPRSA